MTTTRRTTTRVRAADGGSSALTSFLLWTIGILILVSAAVVSWVGSFYIFGHPEEPFSYKVLQTLKKLDPPRRFELTAAPRGEFLSPEALYNRYAELTPRQLDDVNRVLLRNFIRNYQQTKDPVPYVIGQYTILDSFELGPDDVFPSGVVAVARANEDPRVLLEHVFTAPPANVSDLHRMLLTGLELNLQRRMDLSAVVHVEKLRDGRLKVTALPLIYGSYASTQGPGTFSLEPPTRLNVAAGLPVIRSARLEAAAEKYAAYRRRAGLPAEDPATAGTPAAGAQLLRVERPEPVGDATPAAAVAEAVETGGQLLGPDGEPLTIAQALPPADPVGEPVDSPLRVMPALPPEPALDPSVVAEDELPPTATPTPTATPVATPTPTPAPTPAAAIANVQGRNWQVYSPGQMPRGRLVPVNDMPQLAQRGLEGERLYLQGNFVVTAASDERAVLRSQSAVRNPFGGGNANVRIIVDFPAGSSAPGQGERVTRDASRPFLITGVTRGEDGQINVQAREITRP
jgi:hypothetical protein